MSSCPGTTLEDWLTDWFALLVDGNKEHGDTIRNLYSNQLVLTKEQFKPLVDMFEPYREHVELWCGRYSEEENGSWRDYCGVFDIPDGVQKLAEQYLQQLLDTGAITLSEGI